MDTRARCRMDMRFYEATIVWALLQSLYRIRVLEASPTPIRIAVYIAIRLIWVASSLSENSFSKDPTSSLYNPFIRNFDHGVGACYLCSHVDTCRVHVHVEQLAAL